MITVTIGTTDDANASVSISPPYVPLESLDEVEFMVNSTDTDFNHMQVGLSSSPGGSGSGVLAWYDTENGSFPQDGWAAARLSSGTITTVGLVDPVVPFVNGHWYKINLRHLETGVWMLTVTDVTADPSVTGVILITGVSAVNGTPYIYAQNRGTFSKSWNFDYAWWSRRRLQRV